MDRRALLMILIMTTCYGEENHRATRTLSSLFGGSRSSEASAKSTVDYNTQDVIRPLVYQVKYYDHQYPVIPVNSGVGVVPVRQQQQVVDKVGVQQPQQVVGGVGVDLRVEGQHPHSYHHQQQQPQVYYYGVVGGQPQQQQGVPQQVVPEPYIFRQPQQQVPQQQGYLYVNPIIPQQQQQNYYAVVGQSVPCPLDYHNHQPPVVVQPVVQQDKVKQPGVVQPVIQDKYRNKQPQQQNVYSSGVVGGYGVPDYYPYYNPYYYYDPSYYYRQNQQVYGNYNPYNYVVSQSVQNSQTVPASVTTTQNKDVVKDVVKKDI